MAISRQFRPDIYLVQVMNPTIQPASGSHFLQPWTCVVFVYLVGADCWCCSSGPLGHVRPGGERSREYVVHVSFARFRHPAPVLSGLQGRCQQRSSFHLKFGSPKLQQTQLLSLVSTNTELCHALPVFMGQRLLYITQLHYCTASVYSFLESLSYTVIERTAEHATSQNT